MRPHLVQGPRQEPSDGNVTDGATTISGATVAVDGTSLSATTDDNGNYSIANVPEGTTYDVTASAVGFDSKTQSGISVTAGDTTTVDFALAASPTGTVAGIVTNSADGTAISGATVSVDTGQSAQTVSDGSYAITDVPTGDRSITASATGFESNTKAATVIDTEITTVDFALAAVTTATTVSVDYVSYITEGGKNGDKHLLITLAIVDDLGDPVSGASVSIDLFRDSALIASGTGTTGTDGTLTFSLKNAKSGCYTTDVTDVSAGGLTWDEATPAKEFCK